MFNNDDYFEVRFQNNAWYYNDIESACRRIKSILKAYSIREVDGKFETTQSFNHAPKIKKCILFLGMPNDSIVLFKHGKSSLDETLTKYFLKKDVKNADLQYNFE